jgi:hypothetical protein
MLCRDIMGLQRVVVQIKQLPRRVARLREGFYQPPQLPFTIDPRRLMVQLNAVAARGAVLRR